MRAMWTGRVIAALCVLFLLFDATIHILNPAPVVQAMTQLGFRDGVAMWLGIVELACIAVYVYPRTAVLGALLLTGYLGGATAVQVRIGSASIWFPVFFGVLLWAALYLQDARVRAVLPIAYSIRRASPSSTS